MQGNSITSYGNIYTRTAVEKDYAVVTVRGAEVYQLTHKASGEISLAAFESSVAAKRFFAGTKDFFSSKII